ncbi:MAG: histidine kinase [Bacteroidota bacterium]
MRMAKALIFLMILTGMFSHAVHSQYNFVNYNHTNGLPLEEIRTIAEDSLGYIWLGGPLGLARFDGRTFTHYHKGSTSYNLAGNVVNDIAITPEGKVVIVYEDNGVSIYDHKTDSFTSKIYTPSDSTNFPKFVLFFAYIENDTSIYLGGHSEGLYHFNPKTMESRKTNVNFAPYDMLAVPEEEGSFYLTWGGLHKWNRTTGELKKISSSAYAGLRVMNNEIWCNDYIQFLKRFDFDSGKETTYKTDFYGIIRGWTVVDNNLWVGMAEGLEIIDTSSAKVIQVLRAGQSALGIQGNFINDIYQDTKNRVWVATDAGLSVYDPEVLHFERMSFLENSSTYLDAKDPDYKLSLEFYENEIGHITTDSTVSQLSFPSFFHRPVEVVRDDGRVFILFYNGVAEFDPESKSITALNCPYTNAGQRGLIELQIFNNIWFAIYQHQKLMVSWNPENNITDTLQLSGEPRGILPINKNEIWVYGVNVLIKYDPESGKTEEHYAKSKKLYQVGDKIKRIDQIGEDYWISTRMSGIWKAQKNEEGFQFIKLYGVADGVTNNHVRGTQVDEYGNLFIFGGTNFFVLDRVNDRFLTLGGQNDLNMRRIEGFTARDSIVYAMGYKSKSLDLRNWVTPRKHTPIIEKILVNNQLRHQENLETSELRYNENNINIAFTTLEFTNPTSIRHRYRLDTTSSWISLDAGAKNINLSALATGDYHFQLASCILGRPWSKPLNWTFRIAPPFWKQPWFLALMIGLVSAVLFIMYKRRIEQLNKFNSLQLKLADLESESLRAQMNPHFVFNALNSIKSFIIKNDKESAADYLTLFSELVRAVLHNSKQKEISLKSELAALELYLKIENVRLEQKFDYIIHIPDSIYPERIAFPPLIIQPFVENSIWHGFLNKEADCQLDILIRKEEGQLRIDVVDNGIGRAASKKIEKARKRERSYGIAITQNRLHNITSSADVEIIDLYHEDGKSSGTQAIIKLPFKLLTSKN